ncbi:MAG: hypothetical protein HFJ17_02270 [Clostridia bacterium]|nr:hypothetical protein [Clostridia bacterium]
MYNLDIYNKKIDFNNMTYSIDMLRLKTYITYEEFTSIEFLLKSVYKDNLSSWVSGMISQFHYQYNITFEDCSIWFGFMHNNERKSFNNTDLKYNFTIEFNPNKCKDNKLLLTILHRFSDWKLRSFDLAIDIPINILDIMFDLRSRRKFRTEGYGGDNLTHTYGKGNGRIKIYNKKNESKLNIIGNLTRVEVSATFEDYPIRNTGTFEFDSKLFPTVYLNNYVYSFSDYTCKDKMLMCVLYAVNSGYPLKELTRTYKKKLEELITAGYKIKFDKKTATQVFRQTIFHYFVGRESRQVIF